MQNFSRGLQIQLNTFNWLVAVNNNIKKIILIYFPLSKEVTGSRILSQKDLKNKCKKKPNKNKLEFELRQRDSVRGGCQKDL